MCEKYNFYKSNILFFLHIMNEIFSIQVCRCENVSDLIFLIIYLNNNQIMLHYFVNLAIFIV